MPHPGKNLIKILSDLTRCFEFLQDLTRFCSKILTPAILSRSGKILSRSGKILSRSGKIL